MTVAMMQGKASLMIQLRHTLLIGALWLQFFKIYLLGALTLKGIYYRTWTEHEDHRSPFKTF